MGWGSGVSYPPGYYLDFLCVLRVLCGWPHPLKNPRADPLYRGMTHRHFPSRIWLLSLLLPLAAQAQIGVRHFEAPLDQSHWKVTGTPLECRLSHAIPGWGEAVFSRPAGGSLSVRLEPARQDSQAGPVALAPRSDPRLGPSC